MSSKKWKKVVFAVVVCLCACLFLVFHLKENMVADKFQKEVAAVKEEGKIPVVLLAQLSGSYAVPGEGAAWAAQYAVDEINDNGGVNGHQIQLIVKDTRSDKQLASRYYIGASRETLAVLGPVDAPESAEVSEYLTDKKVTSIAAYSYSEVREKNAPYAVSYMSDTQKGELEEIRMWMQKNPQIQEVVIFARKADVSQQKTIELIQEQADTLGIQIREIIQLEGDSTAFDYTKYAVHALNCKADGYISLLNMADYSNLLPELRKRGVSDGNTISASFSAFTDETLQLESDVLDGTYIWSKFNLDYEGENWQKLVNAYAREHQGQTPAVNTIPDMYDAVMALAQCMQEEQITFLDSRREQENRKIADWFADSTLVHGIQGDFYWKNGEKIADYHYFRFDGNQPVTVK